MPKVTEDTFHKFATKTGRDVREKQLFSSYLITVDQLGGVVVEGVGTVPVVVAVAGEALYS